jgi:hypothetical protein
MADGIVSEWRCRRVWDLQVGKPMVLDVPDEGFDLNFEGPDIVWVVGLVLRGSDIVHAVAVIHCRNIPTQFENHDMNNRRKIHEMDCAVVVDINRGCTVTGIFLLERRQAQLEAPEEVKDLSSMFQTWSHRLIDWAWEAVLAKRLVLGNSFEGFRDDFSNGGTVCAVDSKDLCKGKALILILSLAS